MKKLFFLLATVITVISCRALKAPQTTIAADLRAYPYAYIIPTSNTTPADLIAGNLMKRGYTILPSISPELAEKTLIVSYGYVGRRQLSEYSYASCIIIQMRDAKTHKMVATCEAEGCGGNDAEDILQAITTALDNIYTAAYDYNHNRIK